MSARRLASVLGAMLLSGCSAGKSTPGASSNPAATDSSPPTAAAPDSLALVVRPGLEVYFAGSRTDTDSSGGHCIERLLEIRREGRRIAVPLLYTGSLPSRVNDSTIEAPIWLHCRPGNVYQVNLETGQPTRVR
jgi:hypothetical protein